MTRDTNVTLRCHAVIVRSEQDVLSREYTVYKDGGVVYTKTTSTSEDLVYLLPEARVSNSGRYMCKINIGGEEEMSGAKKLTVRGWFVQRDASTVFKMCLSRTSVGRNV